MGQSKWFITKNKKFNLGITPLKSAKSKTINKNKQEKDEKNIIFFIPCPKP
jgi:hypothetical protein